MQPIDNDEEEAGFFSRHRIKLIVAALALAGIVLLVVLGSNVERTEIVKPGPQVVNITVPPPPPPPPPPRPRDPRPEPPPEAREMVEMEAISEPDDAPEPAPAGDAPLGTGVVGDGPADGFGLGTAPGGGGAFRGGTGARSGAGSALGRYGYQVQTSIHGALASHPRTRTLSLGAKIRVWIDANGRIERVEIDRSAAATPEILAAVREALLGVQVRGQAPADMPQPVVLRLDARRPS